jgi:mono/diheme cytochrome c family protein
MSRYCIRTARITAVLLALTAGAGLALAQSAQPAGNVQRGHDLFMTEGCYSCHGTTGTGSIDGPRLAPGPIPWPAFIYQLRHPRGTPPYGNIKMPMFSERVLSDAQAADIFAYLSSVRNGPPASGIALLNEQ